MSLLALNWLQWSNLSQFSLSAWEFQNFSFPRKVLLSLNSGDTCKIPVKPSSVPIALVSSLWGSPAQLGRISFIHRVISTELMSSPEAAWSWRRRKSVTMPQQIYPNLVPVKCLRQAPKATVTLCKAGVVLLLRISLKSRWCINIQAITSELW